MATLGIKELTHRKLAMLS